MSGPCRRQSRGGRVPALTSAQTPARAKKRQVSSLKGSGSPARTRHTSRRRREYAVTLKAHGKRSRDGECLAATERTLGPAAGQRSRGRRGVDNRRGSGLATARGAAADAAPLRLDL